MWSIRLVALTVATLFVLCCQGSTMIFEMEPKPITNQHLVYIKFTYATFNTSVLVYLSNNVSRCGTGTTFSNPWPTAAPLGQVSSVIGWTPHDPKGFLRAPFAISGQADAYELVYVCYSTNHGRNWRTAQDSLGRAYFHLWPAVPTATLIPALPVAGEMLYIHTSNVPKRSKVVLVRSPSKCRGPQPEDSFTTNATLVKESVVFSLRPSLPATLWICVAPPPFAVWSILPVDRNHQLTFGDPPMATDEMPYDGVGFTVYAKTVVLRSIKCNPPLIAGVSTTCIFIMNSSSPTVTAADITIASLTDGAGIEECPYPTIRLNSDPGYSTQRFQFTWTPQRVGSGGRLVLQYKGAPLFFRPDATDTGKSSYDFTVQPEYSYSDEFDYTNYLNLDYMTPKTNFLFRDGIPAPFGGRANGTLAKDMRTATLNLKKATLTDTLLQTVALPALATACRVTVHYYFDGTVTDPYGTQNIGSLRVVAVNSLGADVAVIQTYYLYSYLRQVRVTGASRTGIIDGEARSMEQLVKHFTRISNYASIRLELMVTRATASLLYWAQPELKCVTRRPYTRPSDVEGLQAIYRSLKGGVAYSRLTNWEVTKGSGIWNGDPCRNQWQGVTCRHYRVVELNLANRRLSGSFPDVNKLSRLEVLNLAGNSINGTIPASFANSTRLRVLDATSNGLTGVANTRVLSSTQSCLATIKLAHNQLLKFPRQVLGIPKLQHLDLSFNSMSDALPSFDGAASMIEYANFQANRLYGALPRLNLRTIRSVDFSDNAFNGSIPVQWQGLQQVQFLDVSINNLTGTIPPELSLIRTAERLVFRAAANRHRGLLPNLPFSSVDIRGNVFRCPLPFPYDWVSNPVVGVRSEYGCDFYDGKAANVY